MKRSQNSNFAFATLLIFLCLTNLAAHADTICLTLAPTAGTIFTNYVVPSNTVAQVVYAFGPSSPNVSFEISVQNTGKNAYANYFGNSNGIFTNLPTVVGPTTITFFAINNSGLTNINLGICTIQTSPANNTLTNSVPSNAVVIPADNGGPVTIILESSVDLVNWNASLPGAYGTTSSNRFFRVRAQR